MNLLILAMTMLYPDVHVPTATVEGDIVTVNGDFAAIDTIGQAKVIEGVPLVVNYGDLNPAVPPVPGYNLTASSDGIAPVKWQLPPGTYEITAFGYPDDRKFPMRNKAILTVIIADPTRAEQIKSAYQRFSEANADAATAKKAIKDLKPTKAETAAALAP